VLDEVVPLGCREKTWFGDLTGQDERGGSSSLLKLMLMEVDPGGEVLCMGHAG
jgi:hypothetical protein